MADETSADEEQLAANALGEILASVMMHAYGERMGPRLWLYCWERDGLTWLIRFKERRPDWTMNLWTSNFIDLNREAILDENGRMDFNLKAYDARKRAEAEKTT